MEGPNNLLAGIESVHIQIESDTEESDTEEINNQVKMDTIINMEDEMDTEKINNQFKMDTIINMEDEMDMEDKMDIDEINRQLRKIDDCFCYIIVELNRNDDIENKFYKRFGELLKTLSNETLLKIRDIKRDIYMHKF